VGSRGPSILAKWSRSSNDPFALRHVGAGAGECCGCGVKDSVVLVCIIS
jgi:hypothetical protein